MARNDICSRLYSLGIMNIFDNVCLAYIHVRSSFIVRILSIIVWEEEEEEE